MPQTEIRCADKCGHHARTYYKGAWAALNDRGTTGKIFVEEDDIMAMEITNNYSNLEQVSTEKEVRTKAVKKETEKKSTYGSRREYSEYLNHKYACLTPTKDSSVTINSSLISKAASNPKTAEWLENTLSQMPDCINKICENSAKNGARLVSLEISIDSEDCITTKCTGVFEADPGTEESKKMVEEARARNKERKEEWEKLLEKNKEKKAKQEKLEEKKDGREYDITVMGTDLGKVTESLISKISMGNSAMSTARILTGFDFKA